MYNNQTSFTDIKTEINKYHGLKFKYNDFNSFGSKFYTGIFLNNVLIENNPISPQILEAVKDIYDRLDCQKTTYNNAYACMPTNGLCLNDKPIFHNNYLNRSLSVNISNNGFHLPTCDICDFANLKPYTNVLNTLNKINVLEHMNQPTLIAQQVETLFPHIIYTINGKKGIDMNALIILLIQALKEVQEKK